MKKMMILGNIAILAAWCVVPAGSFAASCGGTNVNTTLSWEESEISEGTKMATWRGTSVIVSDDANAPLHLLAGECNGAFIYFPDGNRQSSGTCSRKDKDGDVLNEAWIKPFGNEAKGTWEHVGGTGKFSGFANAGQWEVIVQEGVSTVVRWSGECK